MAIPSIFRGCSRHEMSNLYRAHSIWRRVSPGQSVRYACFENIGDGRFCVLAADFFNPPLNPTVQLEQDRNIVELLTEEELSVRCLWFDTLTEAIAQHDAEFENIWHH